jgi:hypothetical protein
MNTKIYLTTKATSSPMKGSFAAVTVIAVAATT